MGSHGGGTAAGQRNLIEHYGITEEAMGVPIEDSVETVSIGATPEGVEAFFSKAAWNADGVLLLNRVKPHTDFHGKLGQTNNPEWKTVAFDEGGKVVNESILQRLQEERRLMYVGITRAQRSLAVSWSKKRKKGREMVAAMPSRFIAEMALDKTTVKEDPREKLKALRAEFAKKSAQAAEAAAAAAKG